MVFPDTWSALQANLSAATVNGYPTVPAVTATVVVVDTPGAKTAQTVPRADFQAVYDHWNDYCRGALQRSAFNPLTRYSKYIISILHWLEGRSGGRLP